MELPHRPKYVPTIPLVGLVCGVLSAMPYVGCINCCFFLWVISAGALSVRLIANKSSSPIDHGEGALIGTLTGAMSGLIATLLFVAIGLGFGFGSWTGDFPMDQRLVRELDRYPVFRTIASSTAAFCGHMITHPIFGTLGGLIGTFVLPKSSRGSQSSRGSLPREYTSSWEPPPS